MTFQLIRTYTATYIYARTITRPVMAVKIIKLGA